MVGAYCITKEVKYRASTLVASPPISLTMTRTLSRQRWRSASLPSSVDTGLVGLVAEDHQQVVAHARIVVLDQLFDGRITRHDVDGDLQEAHDGFGFEIDDERRIEIDVARRELDDFFFLVGVFLAAELEPCSRATAAEHQHGREHDHQTLLAALGRSQPRLRCSSTWSSSVAMHSSLARTIRSTARSCATLVPRPERERHHTNRPARGGFLARDIPDLLAKRQKGTCLL